jgi:hypothetical protein
VDGELRADADATLFVEATAVQARGDLVATGKANIYVVGDAAVTVAGETSVGAGATLTSDAQANGSIKTNSLTCGQTGDVSANGKGHLQLDGGSLTVDADMRLDAALCDVSSAGAVIVLSGDDDACEPAENQDISDFNAADSCHSSAESGSYAAEELRVESGARLFTRGDVTVDGDLTVGEETVTATTADAQLKATGALIATGALVVNSKGRLQSSANKACRATSATLTAGAQFTATLGTAAAAQTEAALETTGATTFDGELVIDLQTAVSTGDKFVIARYDSHTGTFASVRVKGDASLNRRRATLAENWQMEYGENEATAEYMGAPMTAPPTTQAPTPAPTTVPPTTQPGATTESTAETTSTTTTTNNGVVETTVSAVETTDDVVTTGGATTVFVDTVATPQPETDEDTPTAELTSANTLFVSIGATVVAIMVTLF